MVPNLQDLSKQIIRYVEEKGVQYCDVRADRQSEKSLVIENGEIEHITNTTDQGLGIRLLKNGSWGFCSFNNPQSFGEIKDLISQTIKNVNYYSEKKNHHSS